MNRRNFLNIAGSTGVIVGAGAIGGFVATRTPHAALQPWQTPGSQYTDPMRRALSYAILAPNPHNRQPWVIDLKSEWEAVLTCDLERLLPATDPFDRQIVIGLGCFLELFSLAAVADGYQAQIALFPEGEPAERLDTRPIAHLKLTAQPDAELDPLFAHVLYRHTNRGAYDMERPIAQATLDQVTAAAGTDVVCDSVGNGPEVATLRTLTRDALRGEIMDPHAYQESIDLMRIGRREIEANPDGIYLGGAFLETLNLLGMLTRENLADTQSSAFQTGLDMVDTAALTAMGFVWINTTGNTRVDQIAAGRAYLRVALSATSVGLAMQPMSQALQEYPAMQPYYKQVHTMLTGGNGERVQMLARLGYADDVPPAPRWALSTRIMQS